MLIDKLILLLVTKDNSSYEYQLSKYFINHRDNILDISIKKVIEDTFVSKSTISRFCHMVGVQNYTNFQHQLNYCYQDFIFQNQDNDYVLSKEIQNILHGKKRIIVYGDCNSLGVLLWYKKLYLLKDVELYFKLVPQSWDEFIKDVEINSSDLFIHLSMFYSFFELNVEGYKQGKNMKSTLEQHHVPIIHIGRFTQDKKETSTYIELDYKNNRVGHMIEICNIFEKFYKYL